VGWSALKILKSWGDIIGTTHGTSAFIFEISGVELYLTWK